MPGTEGTETDTLNGQRPKRSRNPTAEEEQLQVQLQPWPEGKDGGKVVPKDANSTLSRREGVELGVVIEVLEPQQVYKACERTLFLLENKTCGDSHKCYGYSNNNYKPKALEAQDKFHDVESTMMDCLELFQLVTPPLHTNT